MTNTINNMNGAASEKDVAALLKGKPLDLEKQAFGGERLLEIIFPDEDSRPTLRWLRKMQKLRRIPFVKIGRRVWFFPDQVRAAMIEQQVKARGVL